MYYLNIEVIEIEDIVEIEVKKNTKNRKNLFGKLRTMMQITGKSRIK